MRNSLADAFVDSEPAQKAITLVGIEATLHFSA